MSAVQAAEPQQAGLEGIEPPPAVKPMQVAVIGRLNRQALLRISPDGRPHITVEIRQRGDALPFVATYHGTVDQVLMFEDMTVTRLRPGAPVLVRGAGLVLERDEHEPSTRLRLVECSLVRTMQFDDPAEAALV